mmetsp:Transcript_19001/g.33992  ORF Transcript_19001/g.33992 Transcript_19001/m.33992 type:complete len:590 (-) Transcript_19001:268-2037(-)
MGYGSISPEVAQEGLRAGGIRCGSGAVFNRRRPTACTLLGAYVMVTFVMFAFGVALHIFPSDPQAYRSTLFGSEPTVTAAKTASSDTTSHITHDTNDQQDFVFGGQVATPLFLSVSAILLLVVSAFIVVAWCLTKSLAEERQRLREVEAELEGGGANRDLIAEGQNDDWREEKNVRRDEKEEDLRIRLMGLKEELTMTKRLFKQDISTLRAHLATMYASTKKFHVRLEIMAAAQEELKKSPYLGIAVADAPVGLNSGAIVKRVNEGGPGYRQGVLRGDIIRSFAGNPVDGKESFLKSLRNSAPGDVVWIEITRHRRFRRIMLTVGSRQEDLNIRALQLKSLGVVTDMDVKDFRSLTPGHTAGRKSSEGSTSNEDGDSPPAGKGPIEGTAPESLNVSAQEDTSGDMVMYSGSAEQLLHTCQRIQMKVEALRAVSSVFEEIIRDPSAAEELLREMEDARESLIKLRPYLGLGVEPAPHGQGMIVTRVSPDSPGDIQGIQKGDVICKLNGTKVPTLKIWLACCKSIAPGNIAVLDMIRGSDHTLAVIEVGIRSLSFNELHRLSLRAAGIKDRMDKVVEDSKNTTNTTLATNH